jgi:hypothetical protein
MYFPRSEPPSGENFRGVNPFRLKASTPNCLQYTNVWKHRDRLCDERDKTGDGAAAMRV